MVVGIGVADGAASASRGLDGTGGFRAGAGGGAVVCRFDVAAATGCGVTADVTGFAGGFGDGFGDGFGNDFATGFDGGGGAGRVSGS